jgi:CRP-like cAMP-binding protein
MKSMNIHSPVEQFHHPDQNRLLAALHDPEFSALERHLELVPLALGEMLYEPSKQLRHAYFPTTAVISMHYVIESGASAEAAGVGNDGMLGISLYMGGNSTASSAVVQSAGHAYRLERSVLMREFDRHAPLRTLLLRYAQALITQITQTGACNRHHTIEQQLCRWLLATLDRAPPGELVMTQELVGNILGVRRESVTEVAGKLQRLGLIQYRRGHIRVLGRSGLESLACECYEVVRRELLRLLPDPAPRRHSTGLAPPAAALSAPGRHAAHDHVN